MRIEKIMLFMMVVMVCGFATPALAAQASQVVVMKAGSPWCVVGDSVTAVDTSNRTVVPTIWEGRTLVPIRMVLEAFGGSVEWNGSTKQVSCSLGNKTVVLTIDSSAAQVNGQAVTLDVSAQIQGGRTFVPVRFVSENLGLNVGFEGNNQMIVIADSELPSDLTTLAQVQTLIAKSTCSGTPTAFVHSAYQLPSGTVNANVITVDLNDPRVRVEMEMVDDTLGATASFSDIVAASGGAVAVINANFFAAYDAIKDPIGTVMSDGEIIFANSGITSVGISAANEMSWGDPSIFVRVSAADGTATQNWSAYSVNTPAQSADVSIMYTPARGALVSVNCAGHAMTVMDGVISYYYAVSVGDTMYVPPNGYVVYMGSAFTATNYFYVPVIGTKVNTEPYLRVADEEGFVLSDMTEILSGAPRLVKDGVICTTLENGFKEARFTTAVTPRTAIGTTWDGKLLLVNVPAASIQQMRELMLTLGCEDAVNLDGGGSTAMYYGGSYVATPGRKLTTTLQIFVDS